MSKYDNKSGIKSGNGKELRRKRPDYKGGKQPDGLKRLHDDPELKANADLIKEADELLQILAEGMDREFMDTGKDLAELYRAVCTAAAKLPEMELHTELMCVINGEDGLAVMFHRDRAEAGMKKDADSDDDEEDEDDEDEDYDYEEGLLYDGD